MNRRDFLINTCRIGGIAALIRLGINPKEAEAIYQSSTFGNRSGIAGGSICSFDTFTVNTDKDYALELFYRGVIPASTTGCTSGTQIRITINAHSTNDTIIAGSSIGVRSGSTADTVDTPIRITWDTGNNGTTVTAAGTKVSDWINFTWSDSNAHLISFYINEAHCYFKRDETSNTYLTYYKLSPGQDDTLVADITEDGNNYNIPLLIKIEIQ